jgi:hypothetical protein
MFDHYVSTTKPNRLMLFGETVAVHCGNQTEQTDTLCGQKAELYYVKEGGKHSNQGLKDIAKPEARATVP